MLLYIYIIIIFWHNYFLKKDYSLYYFATKARVPSRRHSLIMQYAELFVGNWFINFINCFVSTNSICCFNQFHWKKTQIYSFCFLSVSECECILSILDSLVWSIINYKQFPHHVLSLLPHYQKWLFCTITHSYVHCNKNRLF